MQDIWYRREKPIKLEGTLATGVNLEMIPAPSDPTKKIHLVFGDFFTTTIEEGTLQLRDGDGGSNIGAAKFFTDQYQMFYRRMVLSPGEGLYANVGHVAGIGFEIYYWLDD